MKLTIEIDNVHAPDLLRFLASIHPDQQITSTPDEADTRWATVGELDDVRHGPSVTVSESLAAADALKVAMDDPVEDTRPRLIPVPGKKYRTRHGKITECIGIDDISIECLTEFGEFYYLHDGTPRASRITAPDWEIVEEITDEPAAEPVPVESEDPTQRDLPMPVDAPPLPELPAGKTRWINRGGFSGLDIPAGDRIVYYQNSDQGWVSSFAFSTSLTHIEAI